MRISVVIFTAIFFISCAKETAARRPVLTIYAKDDIYYARDLKITSENGTIDSTFTNYVDLYEWIEDRTVETTHAYFKLKP